MNLEECLTKKMNAIKGTFSPEQYVVNLHMNEEEIDDNALVAFHERFHYLQCIFTPYGHLKWALFRGISGEIINLWNKLSEELKVKRKIPIYKYLEDGTKDSFKIAANIHMQDAVYQLVMAVEYGEVTDDLKTIYKINEADWAPLVETRSGNCRLHGIDILESFAKFQEAEYGYIFYNIPIAKTIDRKVLPVRYYSAIDYYFSVLGFERIEEFPLVCELSLYTAKHCMINHDNYQKNHPGWRFVEIVGFLKENISIRLPKNLSRNGYNTFANKILSGCGYNTIECIWGESKRYEEQFGLSMSNEMLRAMEYKNKHPWILSYPFENHKLFYSDEFNAFQPYFTVTYDSVYFNLQNISSNELIFENHFQALVLQLCGRMSSRCLYSNMLQCGFSYFGLKNCPHQKDGRCDGHVDKESGLLELVLDEQETILEGCSFEAIFNIMGTSIRDIDIGCINRKVTFSDLSKAAKQRRGL